MACRAIARRMAGMGAGNQAIRAVVDGAALQRPQLTLPQRIKPASQKLF